MSFAQIGVLVLAYLIGSVSFTRLLARGRIPDIDIAETEFSVTGSSDKWVYTGVSATSLGTRIGARWGVLVVFLDAVKALVPTLFARLAWPDESVYLAVALAVVVGHIWPVWHRFRGGRGQSCILGSLLVIDPLAVLFGAGVGAVIGIVMFTSVYLARNGSPFYFVPWFLLIDGPGPTFSFSIGLALVYLLAILPDLKEERRIRQLTRFDTYPWNRRFVLATKEFFGAE